MSFSNLFSAGKIGECELDNRIIMSLFPTKYATQSKVNAKMTEFYRQRAQGGVSLIVLDCPCLDYPRAYKGPTELRFDLEEHAKTLRQLINVLHEEGSKAFMHLNYPKERVYDTPVDGAKKKGEVWIAPTSNAMSVDEAHEILEIMAKGALRAKEIGYDGVEIQASYGGLIAQLLSPLLNKRNDEMGGSLENRTHFLTKLIKKVKSMAGKSFPVMVKLVCDEFVQGGLSIDEGKEIARLVENAGADAIVANGGNKSSKYRTIPSQESPPAPLVDLAAQIKTAVSIPVVAIGKINNPRLADEIIGDQRADFIAMVRALVADPTLPKKAQSGKVDDIRGCVCCLEDCVEKGVPGIGRCCTVNPFAGLEHVWKILPVSEEKNILVVGGGPSGMQAAVIAKQRGHNVELWERSHELGGQARLANIAPFKEEMSEVLRYLKHLLKKAGVKIRLEHEATDSKIIAHGADVVVIATGSHPGSLSLPGIDSASVIQAKKVYEKGGIDGQSIVIVGGGDIGCETADWLAGEQRKVTIVEILPKVASKMKKIPRGRLLSRLKGKGVAIHTETEIASIREGFVQLRKKDDGDFDLKADKVILAVTPEAEYTLVDSLKGKVGNVIAIGDAASPGNIGSALRNATEVALRL